jgi:hypothetical protein
MGWKIYKNLEEINYYSERYKKRVVVPYGYWSDGATGATDLSGDHPCMRGPDKIYTSQAWWVHDVLCDRGTFEDGTICKNWQASMVLKDILKAEGRWVRDFWWFTATWLFGGGEARKNGMW